ncbi:hypothetical protein [Streptomyces flavochromogenes]|uniref:hypothetical protein n=1 Tax=Streptomyces flavochromogenes TaxID=68199 RepID=UPI0004C1590B|nr:hypothetical protein [Streptomyces flavochromogenes]
MVISHVLTDGILHVTLPCDLDVTHRAAAALETETLVHAHRPRIVQLKVVGSHPSPASLSALARARRMCTSLGIPLAVVGPAAAQQDASAEPTAA